MLKYSQAKTQRYLYLGPSVRPDESRGRLGWRPRHLVPEPSRDPRVRVIIGEPEFKDELAVVGHFDCGEGFAMRSSARLARVLVLGGNAEHHLFGCWIGYVFRHSTSFYGAGAPVLWIIKVRPRHGEKGQPCVGSLACLLPSFKRIHDIIRCPNSVSAGQQPA